MWLQNIIIRYVRVKIILKTARIIKNYRNICLDFEFHYALNKVERLKPHSATNLYALLFKFSCHKSNPSIYICQKSRNYMLRTNNLPTSHKITTDIWSFLQHSRRLSKAIYVKAPNKSIAYQKIHIYKEILLDK